MKNLLLCLLVCWISLGLFAQSPSVDSPVQPAAVPSAELREMPRSEYQQQASFWESRVKAAPSDENAWLNLFKARLYENYTPHSRKVSANSRQQLSEIVRSIEENAPGSFTYFYCDYLYKQKTDAGLESLKKAADKAPGNVELLDDMMFYYIRYSDAQRITQYAMKAQAAGIYNAAIMEYNRNALSSTEQGATLITYGAQDTYPLIILQYAMQFRQDVRIVCMEWLVNETYRSNVKQSMQLSSALTSDDDKQNLQRLCSSTTGPVFVGLTLPPDALSEVRKRLYCTGLTLKHSPTAIVNLPSLAYSWENLFVKTHLASGQEINVNYLIPMLELYAYYETTDQAKAAAIKTELLSLAARFGKTSLVQPFIR
jgi:hypothetical protein